jgi:hypothetical protein
MGPHTRFQRVIHALEIGFVCIMLVYVCIGIYWYVLVCIMVTRSHFPAALWAMEAWYGLGQLVSYTLSNGSGHCPGARRGLWTFHNRHKQSQYMRIRAHINTYKISVIVLCLYWFVVVEMLVFVCIGASNLTQYIHNTCSIHTNTYQYMQYKQSERGGNP